MSFWLEVLASTLANLISGTILVALYVAIQWYLRATDVTIGYSWRFEGPLSDLRNLRPSFDIRNRSGSKTYFLGNVAYFKSGKPVAAFDNKSLWGTELRPGTITLLEAAAVESFSSVAECLGAQVHVRLQNGRTFWLKGQGPGQLKMATAQRAAFWLRDKIESIAVPME